MVFDPTAPLAKLTAGRITIDDEGYLDIGSADCPFAGNAEILLTGNYYIWRSISKLLFRRSQLITFDMFTSKELEMTIRMMMKLLEQNF